MEWNAVIDALQALADKLPEIRELADLKAQEDMAFWAKWMFWASAVSTIFAGFAFIILLVSLRQTSQAIGDNRKLGEDQTRAYVHVASARHSWTESGYGMIISVENAGETPARIFEVGGRMQKIKVGDVSGSVVHQIYKMKSWAALGPKLPPTTVRLDTSEYRDLIVEFGTPVKDHVLLLTGTVRYQDIYNHWFETDFAFYSYTSATTEPDRYNKLRRPTARLRAYERVKAPEGVPLNIPKEPS